MDLRIEAWVLGTKSIMGAVAHATTTAIRDSVSILWTVVFLPLSFGSLDSAAALSSDLFLLCRVIAFERTR